MTRPVRNPRLLIEVDEALAAEYRSAYVRAFGSHKDRRQRLEKFIAGFTEDRLREELEFVRHEAREDS